MARQNKAVAVPVAVTHEGGRAEMHQTPLAELERAVSTCLLWENSFYEGGDSSAARIAALCTTVQPEDIARLAVTARTDLKLRHVPLWLCVQLLAKRTGTRLASDTIAAVVRRPDEAGELLALYWRDRPRDGRRLGGRGAVPKQLKVGLAAAFTKWDAYQLAKWNRDAAVKLRDVMYLVHPKPKDGGVAHLVAGVTRAGKTIRGAAHRHDAGQGALWTQLHTGTLPTPDTWEVGLSAAKTPEEKRAVWTRLLLAQKLPAMATLANLRNMDTVGVEATLVDKAIERTAGGVALPFRYVSAAKVAPAHAQALSDAMVRAAAGGPPLPGRTAVVIDVSGSMVAPISAKGTLHRWEAAAALAALIREQAAGGCRVFAYATGREEVANLRGLALVEAVRRTPSFNGGTNTLAAVQFVAARFKEADRVVVITDEQAHDTEAAALPLPNAEARGYLINVAPYQPGLVLGGRWARINGWSERVVDWLRVHEGLGLPPAGQGGADADEPAEAGPAE